jgi:2-polyprenyl-3-methyl-5-hydroxy-6-metoxy-1,4-benzoquinol methylase
MFEKKPQSMIDKIKLLAQQSLQRSDPSWWFDVLYQEAKDDFTQIPWAKMKPHPYFQDWLDNLAQINRNHSALVIGCGLGDDAEALANVGFSNVTAFDISPHAINWCKQRFPQSSVNYVVADLFQIDSSWQHKFDLVYECRNIQALPLSVRSEVISSIANLVAQDGILLVINRLRDTDEEPQGPPWALSLQEFNSFTQFGLQEKNLTTFFEGDNQEVTTVRVEYHNG